MILQLLSWTFNPENENQCSHKNLHTNGHNSFICDSQKLKWIQISFNRIQQIPTHAFYFSVVFCIMDVLQLTHWQQCRMS